jgi:hypothetical protein
MAAPLVVADESLRQNEELHDVPIVSLSLHADDSLQVETATDTGDSEGVAPGTAVDEYDDSLPEVQCTTPVVVRLLLGRRVAQALRVRRGEALASLYAAAEEALLQASGPNDTDADNTANTPDAPHADDGQQHDGAGDDEDDSASQSQQPQQEKQPDTTTSSMPFAIELSEILASRQRTADVRGALVQVQRVVEGVLEHMGKGGSALADPGAPPRLSDEQISSDSIDLKLLVPQWQVRHLLSGTEGDWRLDAVRAESGASVLVLDAPTTMTATNGEGDEQRQPSDQQQQQQQLIHLVGVRTSVHYAAELLLELLCRIQAKHAAAASATPSATIISSSSAADADVNKDGTAAVPVRDTPGGPRPTSDGNKKHRKHHLHASHSLSGTPAGGGAVVASSSSSPPLSPLSLVAAPSSPALLASFAAMTPPAGPLPQPASSFSSSSASSSSSYPYPSPPSLGVPVVPLLPMNHPLVLHLQSVALHLQHLGALVLAQSMHGHAPLEVMHATQAELAQAQAVYQQLLAHMEQDQQHQIHMQDALWRSMAEASHAAAAAQQQQQQQQRQQQLQQQQLQPQQAVKPQAALAKRQPLPRRPPPQIQQQQQQQPQAQQPKSSSTPSSTPSVASLSDMASMRAVLASLRAAAAGAPQTTQLTLHVPSTLLGSLIGRGGARIAQVRANSGASIQIEQCSTAAARIARTGVLSSGAPSASASSPKAQVEGTLASPTPSPSPPTAAHSAPASASSATMAVADEEYERKEHDDDEPDEDVAITSAVEDDASRVIHSQPAAAGVVTTSATMIDGAGTGAGAGAGAGYINATNNATTTSAPRSAATNTSTNHMPSERLVTVSGPRANVAAAAKLLAELIHAHLPDVANDNDDDDDDA